MHTKTDANGSFKFSGLNNGKHYIWVDYPGITNSISLEISLSNQNHQISDLNLELTSEGLTNCDDNITSIQNASNNDLVSYLIFPNPTIKDLTILRKHSFSEEILVHDLIGNLILYHYELIFDLINS